MKGALVTGGARGIGRAIVAALAKDGWNVTFLYRSDDAAAQKTALETGAVGIRCDVSDRESVLEAVRNCGRIDLLVNNAGISQFRLFTDITEEDWQRMIGVNLTGVFHTTQAVLPQMISRKSGAIVNIASMWGAVGASCETHYSASKGGVIALTKALAKEVGPSGIRVNGINPGVIETDMNGHLSEEDKNALADDTPLCRLGQAEEVAKAVLFLASDDASFITGQVLGVDGGFIT